jgi:hypothetical protein
MCSGCFSLTGVALDRYAAALIELRERRAREVLDPRGDVARRYDVPLALLPEEDDS